MILHFTSSVVISLQQILLYLIKGAALQRLQCIYNPCNLFVFVRPVNSCYHKFKVNNKVTLQYQQFEITEILFLLDHEQKLSKNGHSTERYESTEASCRQWSLCSDSTDFQADLGLDGYLLWIRFSHCTAHIISLYVTYILTCFTGKSPEIDRCSYLVCVNHPIIN